MKAISTALVACALGCAAHAPVAQAATETVLYSFCGQLDCFDGQQPQGSLINIKGLLYGTATGGGTTGAGTVYALNPRTRALTVLHSFSGSPDGNLPEAALINVKGTLYGTTYFGGATGGGTVFSLNPTTGAETVLYSFCSQTNCNDGEFPEVGLLSVGSALYGTTYEGGAQGIGTVFSFNPTPGAETVLHSFQPDGTDGEFPQSNLIDIDGILFGTTGRGGPYSGGTVFAFDPKPGFESVLYDFGNGSDGREPLAGLINVNGTLYGTTAVGGTFDAGTVFSFDLNTGVETVLYSFCSQSGCADGEEPLAGLINVGGILYGTTQIGGGGGTVFSLNPETRVETVVHSFGTGDDGALPFAGLIDVGGKLYGTTAAGGASNNGTVFEIVP